MKTFYLAAGFQQTGSDTSSATMPENRRAFIAETPTLDLENPQYFKPNMLGGSVEWDLDLSNVECGCLATFYMIKVPGLDARGNIWMDTDGYGYCDAN